MFRKITIFLLAFCLLLSCPMTIFAAVGTQEGTAGSTEIATEVPSTHTLTVTAENAVVTYNGESGTSFTVPRLEEFTLSVSASDGYLISKILLDGEDVTADLSGGILTLDGINDASELSITTIKVSGILYDIPEQDMPDEDAVYKVAIEVGGLTEVPEGLKDIAALDTVEEIEAALQRILIGSCGYPEGNVVVYDVTLVVSLDGGRSWEKATAESFPEDGLEIIMPYPDGTGRNTHNFAATHMFTTSDFGNTPGGTENLDVTKVADGLQVTVHGLSPIAVAWDEISAGTGSDNSAGSGSSESSDDGNASDNSVGSGSYNSTYASDAGSVQTGDNRNVWLWISLAIAGGFAVLCTAVYRRRKTDS